jgi:polysaccharide biosynthesis protein PslA
MQSASEPTTAAVASGQGRPGRDRRLRAGRAPRASRAIYAVGIGCLAALCDFGAVTFAASASPLLYRAATLGLAPAVEPVAGIGVVVGALVVICNVQRGEYAIRRFDSLSGHFGRCFTVWNIAFFFALALGFATKTTGAFSRGATGVLYVAGLVALGGGRAAIVGLVEAVRRRGLLVRRRLVLAGFEAPLSTLARRIDRSESGMEVVAAITLRESEADLPDDLALIGATVRMLRADDVVFAIPWAQTGVIEACVDACLRTPAEIHLAPESILDRFADAEVVRLGPICGLGLTRRPLSLLQRFEKRLFDLTIAALALVLLAPLFVVVAMLVRLDGPGPIFFMQRRYGFNREPFRIVKFRTMAAMEDDAQLISATRFDPRVTRVGAVLRRASIDELPQLLNVLAGDMSLVGPRPHAIAHDQRYEGRIARYARRHNVKPGITGWAQVCGLRGEIAGEDKMRRRVEHDLYYIDNWSLWLDLKIIVMTIFSPKTHSGAY